MPPSKSRFAKKSFGQNFLIDQSFVDKIIAAADVGPGDVVVEIGPGRGALTEKLLALAGTSHRRRT
jgi:Dimethyladenosine transferase (rRNA methylation)